MSFTLTLWHSFGNYIAKVATSEDRTHDLSLTKGTHYHYAMEATLIQTLHIPLIFKNLQ